MLTIKEKSQSESYLNLFDIADSSKKEINLSKILAYIISKDANALRALLNIILTQNDIAIIKHKKSSQLLNNSHIAIEVSDKNEGSEQKKCGRTDIEITINSPSIFIIIECKTGENKATVEQFNIYRERFKEPDSDNVKKYFVYMTDQSGIHIHDRDINIIDLTWREAISTLSYISGTNQETQAFVDYYERSYGMSNQKEILVQDIKEDDAIEMLDNYLYRRNRVNGAPLYFAPYFTRQAKNKNEGISQIHKILGIITTESICWEKVENSCCKFITHAYPKIPDDEKQKILSRWRRAVNIAKDDSGKDSTYYFLDEPVLLSPSLKKSPAKDWINKRLPMNRCVTFAAFITNSTLSRNKN